MSYTHLSIIERSKLETLHQQGKSSRAIAKELGRHPSTICRELERTASFEAYEAEQAQNAYQERRKASVSAGKWSATFSCHS
jgi:IS30 family transposase